ncbi:site-specific integrase [Lutispora sp.]|uniref:site-specific integrase n=1 Tax=Lutispora sp. TaxID=2828727 RepID=UPI002B219D4C|nr:site-specific integrase [Lutispora sp.]MEA4962603.1 site-specific integrase [Lutispora sp.]
MVTLFTGMREGEVLGLKWDCVDFTKGILTINKQLQHGVDGKKQYTLVSTKNGKGRTVTPAASIMELLKHHKAVQAEQWLKAGKLWEDSGLVFTDELGHHLTHPTVYHSFKRVAAQIGRPDARFHDLRHSYAVAAIRSGDDIKTVQGNLGHATAAFTLDVYGHVTDQMKKESAARMDAFIVSFQPVKGKLKGKPLVFGHKKP